MRLLFNLFKVLALTSRPHARPLLAVGTGLGFAGNDKMPEDMFYGMYALRDRYSMDQVPLQNRGAKLDITFRSTFWEIFSRMHGLIMFTDSTNFDLLETLGTCHEWIGIHC